MTNRDPIIVIDRATGATFEEEVLGEKWIRWAYQDSGAGLLEKALFRSSAISKLMGAFYDSGLSKGKIRDAINQLDIDESEFANPTESFTNFNDFFIRHLKPECRPYDKDPSAIVSPADGRVLVFPKLDDNQFMPVKGYPFRVTDMLPGAAGERYRDGALVIVRLCPADYHRYHFPCDGKIVDYQDIDGALHSVNPIALGAGPDVFGQNKRSYTLVDTGAAGVMAYVEVGAFGVGSIVNGVTSGKVQKMDEKGYFKFGGSTVVLVFEKDRIAFSDDLVANSAKGRETLVKVGEPMAKVL